MSDVFNYPASYPEVDALLRELLKSARAVLGHHFIGAYLFGSLATGDFDRASDVDVLAVTDEELSAELFTALRDMHARIAAIDSPWAEQLEVSYIPRRAVRRHDPARALHPHLDRGGGEGLRLVQHDSDWVIQRHTLRERGVTLAGPDARTLIDPVSPEDLRRAVLETLRGWWAQVLDDRARLNSRGYQSYSVLTMCRILYTLEHGRVVSKPFAAQWAKGNIDGRWSPLIERALIGRHHPQSAATPEDLDETSALIRHTLERGRQFETGAADDGRPFENP
jgi:predicted nucleotidyltransferase